MSVRKLSIVLIFVFPLSLVVISALNEADIYMVYHNSCKESADLEVYAKTPAETEIASLATLVICSEVATKKKDLNWLAKKFVPSDEEDIQAGGGPENPLTDAQKAAILRQYIEVVYPDLRMRFEADRRRKSISASVFFCAPKINSNDTIRR